PKKKSGYDIYIVHGWDYPALCETYIAAASIVRMEQVPAIIHVDEMTQPQGHSTSGSHERYKSKERLDWENEFDCIRKMREWMIGQGIATADELNGLERDDLRLVREAQHRAWDAYRAPIDAEVRTVVGFIDELASIASNRTELDVIKSELQRNQAPYRRDAMKALTSALIAGRTVITGHEDILNRIAEWRRDRDFTIAAMYDDELYSSGIESALNVDEVKPQYAADAPEKNGSEIINACLDAAMQRYPNLIAMGEDVGKLGDVNQGCLGLQEKYGFYRVSDTGIRECTIVGQAIGMALRGLRPIAEIQYLDYILYAIQILSDDLATTRWRTRGGQKCPVIIRTRGHRLEGVWHSGSPMSAIINLVRGMRVCVPRNMTQAAGFYNTLFRSDDPGLVVEVLNGYRIKEQRPSNIADFTLPLGVPEVIRQGSDVT
ncbi:MAG: transketolase, partial [Thermoanaerobaculia bacterium]